jgi:4-hydroxybenzoate polyprenyltransferase
MESNTIKARASINDLPGTPAPARPEYKLVTGKEYGLSDRLSGFLTLIRPFFSILTPINAASAAVLSLGGYPSLTKCILGFLAVAFASCAVNVFNDYIDRERDKDIWPTRPLPGGRVKPDEARLVVIISLAVSLSIAWISFNSLTFFILLLAIILGGLYSIYLRDRVGYLSLPPIVGLIYLGGWAAFSLETLFSSWLPWYLCLLGVVWQTAHIMIYYPLHIISDNKPTNKVPPALFFTPSPQVAVKIGLVFTCLTLLLGALLPLLAHLGALFLVMVMAAGIYALISGLKFLSVPLNRKLGITASKSLSVFRLVISAAILLSILLSQI